MTWLLVVLGLVVFAVGLLASIALHELGHLSFAKLFKVKTTQYMVGFGPTLWSRRRGDTEYGVKAIPLGGYIRMVGMFPPGKGEDEAHLRRASTSPWGAMAEDVRTAMYEEVKDEDQDRVFYRKPWWQKVIIMLAGPAANLLIAAVCFTVLLTGFGVPELTPRVGLVSECAPRNYAEREIDYARAAQDVTTTAELDALAEEILGCRPDDPPAPAAAAGLEPGDRIIRFDGQPVQEWEDVSAAIRTAPTDAVDLVVLRDGEEVALTAQLVERERVAVGATLGGDGSIPTESVRFLGISPTQETVKQPVTEVPGQVVGFIGSVAQAVVAIPSKVPGIVEAIAGGQRARDSPVGIVGAGRISADIAVAQDIERNQQVAYFISLLASLNMSLFLFNLVPLLPLDGGHVAGALYEQARRVAARLRRRPDPGAFDTARLMPAAYLFASVLIMFTVLVLVADIVNPVRLLS